MGQMLRYARVGQMGRIGWVDSSESYPQVVPHRLIHVLVQKHRLT